MAPLSPAVVSAIDDLEVAARGLVEGLRVGGQRSPLLGYGSDFHQHRPYRTGDDLRHLDWKVYARSDRLYTRQFRETTNLSLMLVLDTSASMAYGDGDTAPSKFRLAVLLAAALAYLATEQGHAVGVMTETVGELTYLPARRGPVHRRALLATLDRLRPAGTWQPARVIGRAAELLPRRGLLMACSDFYDDETGTQRALRQAVQCGHDVAMLQVIAGTERRLDFREPREVVDLETGVRQVVDPVGIADRYAEAMTAFLAGTRDVAVRQGMDYGLFRTDQPLERTLREYLVRRATRALPAAHD